MAMRRWLRGSVTAMLLTAGCGETTSPPPANDGGTLTDARPADGGGTSDAGACQPAAATGPLEVATDRGTVRGEMLDRVVAWRGIPYAAPPVGALRFRAPSEAACWSDVRPAVSFGAKCPQMNAMGALEGQEDCLTLNVWSPTERTAGPLPVMVFIHGGGNNQGSASEGANGVALYDGRSLAARGVVLVTLQYRLGALGFLSHAGLDQEDVSQASGNQALRDQLAALRWVQRNIRAFGGDPSRVTIFGESAGGANVCSLVTSPRAQGLFQRAIMESGGCAAMPQAVARATGERLVQGTGCGNDPDPIACLRRAPIDALFRAVPVDVNGLVSPPWNTSIDGDLLPIGPGLAVGMGQFNRVGFILGTNRDETYRFLPPPPLTELQYNNNARAFLQSLGLGPVQIQAVLALYPSSQYDSPHAALVALTTDIRWTCPARSIARAFRMNQTEPVYRYYFTKTLDPMRAPVASRFGAYHALELFYVFGTLTIGGYVPTEGDLRVSDAMQRYWTRFATTGDPNGMGDPMWPGYGDSDPYVEFADPTTVGAGVRTTQCDGLARIAGGG